MNFSITKEFLQERVDLFREEIMHNFDAPLEHIKVEEIRFNFIYRALKPLFGTKPGVICYDSQNCLYGISKEDIDRYLLHELGHRTAESLSPGIRSSNLEAIMGMFYRLASRPAKKFLKGKAARGIILKEGIAECLCLDLFPTSCTVSKTAINLINFYRQIYHRPIAENLAFVSSKGYLFWNELYERCSAEGVISHIRAFSENSLPSYAELRNPAGYWEKHHRTFP